MNYIQLPTNLLIRQLPNSELLAIVKYQMLWAKLEKKPDEKTIKKYLTKRQIELLSSWRDRIDSFMDRKEQA